MEKSFVVLGKSLEGALDKAELVLHCPKERIAYEILQDSKPGRNGYHGVPCKLRVVPVALSAEELEAPEEQAATRDERLPWTPSDLEAMPSPVFLLSLQNLMALVPRSSAFPLTDSPDPDEVPEFKEIIQDVTSSTHLPPHHGDIHIHGNVRKGARIRATGKITVYGDVETAFLDAGGAVTITGGLLGTVRSRSGSIFCKFAQGARLTATDGDIVVEESAMHSHLRAGRTITVCGILLGGSSYAEALLEVGVAGSETGVPTHLISGKNTRLMQEVEEIRAMAVRQVASLQQQDTVCQELRPIEEAGTPLPVDDRLRLWRALMEKTRINDILAQLSRRKSQVLGMINQDRNARICIIDRAFPRVKITVDELTQEIQHVTQYATFTKDYDDGELRMTSYR